MTIEQITAIGAVCIAGFHTAKSSQSVWFEHRIRFVKAGKPLEKIRPLTPPEPTCRVNSVERVERVKDRVRSIVQSGCRKVLEFRTFSLAVLAMVWIPCLAGGDDQWRPEVAELPWQYIVIHHSAGQSGSVEEIDAEHRRRKGGDGQFWLGIGYHFVIGNGKGMEDGEIRATFRWDEQIHGAHSGHAAVNARGIGICLIGDFEQAPPTAAQWISVQRLVKSLASRHHVSPRLIIGHSSVKPTSCPGRHFPLNELRKVAAGIVE
jgi:N-acetylmuramoyl-L-alanine amidase